MQPSVSSAPSWVSVILRSHGTFLAARIGLSSAYLVGGLVKLFDFQGAVAEQQHFGMYPAAFWAILTIAVELIGSAIVISGRLVWLGAGLLGVFTGLAAMVANNFWTMQGDACFAATNAFVEHIGLIAGFVLAAMMAEAFKREQTRN